MAAGLGFKDFQTGEVLTAADVDGYLMQGIWVFASAAARDAAVTSPQEGNFAYLKDTNVTTYYTGSAWANLDTTGMTNPMTTTGDVIYSSSGSTPARLGIGTAGQVLQVNSGATAPEWASLNVTENYSLLNAGGTALTGAQTVTVSGISGKGTIMVLVDQASSASANSVISLRFNGDTAANYLSYGFRISGADTFNSGNFTSYRSNATGVEIGQMNDVVASTVSGYVLLHGCNSSGVKPFQAAGGGTKPSGQGTQDELTSNGVYNEASLITSVSVFSSSGNLDGGTVFIYGSA